MDSTEILGGLVLLIVGGFFGTILERLKKRHEHAFDRRADWYEEAVTACLGLAHLLRDPHWEDKQDSEPRQEISAQWAEARDAAYRILGQSILYASGQIEALVASPPPEVADEGGSRDDLRQTDTIFYIELATMLAAEYRKVAGFRSGLFAYWRGYRLRKKLSERIQLKSAVGELVAELEKDGAPITVETVLAEWRKRGQRPG